MKWRLKMWMLMKREAVGLWFVGHLPKRLVWWCGIRLMTEVSTRPPLASQELGSIAATDALTEWRNKELAR